MMDFGIICYSALQNLYYLTEEMSSTPQLAYPCTLPYHQLLADGCEAVYSKMLPFIIQTQFFEAVQKNAHRYHSQNTLGRIR